MNFHPTTQKSQNFTLMGSFYPKYIRFELKKYRGVTKMWTLYKWNAGEMIPPVLFT